MGHHPVLCSTTREYLLAQAWILHRAAWSAWASGNVLPWEGPDSRMVKVNFPKKKKTQRRWFLFCPRKSQGTSWFSISASENFRVADGFRDFFVSRTPCAELRLAGHHWLPVLHHPEGVAISRRKAPRRSGCRGFMGVDWPMVPTHVYPRVWCAKFIFWDQELS